MVVLHGGLLWGSQVLSGGDLTNYFIPVREGQLERGWFVGWQPETFSGRPLLDDIQSGFYYPLNWLHLIIPSVELCFTFLTMLHLVIGATGFFLLTRKETGFYGSTLAGVLYACCGYQILRLTNGVVLFNYALAWIPWMWMATREVSLSHRTGLSNLGKLIIFGFLQIAVGAPQIVQITWFGLGFLILFRLISESDWKERSSIAVAFICAGILSLVAALPTLVSAFRFIGEAAERGLADRWAYLSDGSLHPRVMLTWIFPEIFGDGNSEEYYWGSGVGYIETNIYMGVLPIFLAIFAVYLKFVNGGRRVFYTKEYVQIAALLVAGILGLLIALGSHGFLFYILVEGVPSFDFFRVPARWIFWLVFGTVYFSAYGLEALLDRKNLGLRSWLLPAGILLFLILLVSFSVKPLMYVCGVANFLGQRSAGQGDSVYAELFSSAYKSVFFTLIISGAIVLIVSAYIKGGLKKNVFLALVAFLFLVDMYKFWMPYDQVITTGTTSEEVTTEATYHKAERRYFDEFYYPETRLIKNLQSTPNLGRVHFNDLLYSHFFDQFNREFIHERPIVHDINITRGYQQLHLESYRQDFYSSFPLPDGEFGAFFRQQRIGDRNFLDAYNVTHFLTYPVPEFEEDLKELGLVPLGTVNEHGMLIYGNPHARGWAWVSDEEEFMTAEPMEEGAAVDVEAFDPDLFSFTIRVDQPCWLHISSPDYSGWKLEVVEQTNGPVEAKNSRSVYLPDTGEYKVTRRFENVGLKMTFLIPSFLVFLLGLALSLVNMRAVRTPGIK